MLKKFLKQLKRLVTKEPQAPADDGRSRPTKMFGDYNGNVQIKTQSQLDKWTDFKPGEQYMLGEAIVTVHASKADARRAVLMTYLKRRAKRSALRERAIELMLMTPEQLEKLHIDEWLTKRELKHQSLRKRLKSRFWNKKIVNHEPLPNNESIATKSKDNVTTQSQSKVVDKLKVK